MLEFLHYGSSTMTAASGEGPRNKRNLLGYWLLGLCNNYGYVVMLSAAHDILSSDFHAGGETVKNVTNGSRDCNPTSTGAILLADVIPSLTIKMIAPFLPFLVHIRVLMVIILGAAGFLLVALSSARWVAICGVVCTALGSGLGEGTFLSYSAFFERNVISTWSSGTGGAGIAAAVSYAWLTAGGISPRNSLLLMLSVQVLMAFTFWCLLKHPEGQGACCPKKVASKSTSAVRPESAVSAAVSTVASAATHLTIETESSSKEINLELPIGASVEIKTEMPSDVETSTEPTPPGSPPDSPPGSPAGSPAGSPPGTPPSESADLSRNIFSDFVDKLKSVPALINYMLALGTVFLFEYFINQGLFELIYFDNTSISHQEQYRWFQVVYQIGVFLSRSSVNCCTIDRLWVLSVWQAINVGMFTLQVIYKYIPVIWIVFGLILWEGLLGGAAYVNTYNKILYSIPEDKREFSMGITCVADAIGITLAGLLSIPVHNILCALPEPQ